MTQTGRPDAMQRAQVASQDSMSFDMLGLGVEVTCGDADLRAILLANFGQMLAQPLPAGPSLRYRVVRCAPGSISLVGEDGVDAHAEDASALLYLLEKAIVVALQRRCPHLLFLHAAALTYAGGAWLVAGESGSGKSSLAWALLHHGCGYLSDELSPVVLDTLDVCPYPHALCLKRLPAGPYPLPPETVDLGATLHIPVRGSAHSPSPSHSVRGVLLLERGHGAHHPHLERLGAAEAAARIYVVTLNALAHPAQGIDAVLRVAESAACFRLRSGTLTATAETAMCLFRSLPTAHG